MSAWPYALVIINLNWRFDVLICSVCALLISTMVCGFVGFPRIFNKSLFYT